jgi:outer membrane protein assembly factor BamB
MNCLLWCSLAASLFIATATAAEQPVNLLEAGSVADLTLVLSGTADPLVEYAASELVRHLKKVTGIKPQIVHAQNSAAQILMGKTNLMVLGRMQKNALLKNLARDGFFKPNDEEQGYSIRADTNPLDPDGKSWGAVLCGADPLGVLYAVRDFTHYHFYHSENGPLLEPVRISFAPTIKVRYISESGCNLFSAENDQPDFMQKPSLNGYSRKVVFDKHYFIDWLSHWKVTHMNLVWCNSSAYDDAADEMIAYAASRGIQVWRHYVPYRPQHEYPPVDVSTEPPTSRNGDCPRNPIVRRWYLNRLERLVTQKPLIAGVVIESPYHDSIFCHCDQCRGTKNRYPEKEMLDEFIGFARKLRPELQIIRVTNTPIPDQAAARSIAKHLGDIAEKVDVTVNTHRDRTHRTRWHDLGSGYGTYLRTFRSALKGKDIKQEIDFLYNDFRLSSERGVTAHGFCYRFYNGRFGSFKTQEDRMKIEENPHNIGPLSLALVAEAAFEPAVTLDRRLHKLQRIAELTINDYPRNGSFAPEEIDKVASKSPSQFFRSQYYKPDLSFCISQVCVDFDGDGRRELLFASRKTKQLQMLNADDGTIVWNKRLAGDQQSISAYDLDGDGDFEILYSVSNPGRLYVLDHSGKVLHQWDSGDNKLGNSAVVIDADGDGQLDGLFGSRSKYLLRLNMSDMKLSERRSGWVQCGCQTTAMDVDRDGRWDMFAGSGDDSIGKGVLHRYDPVTLKSVWSYKTNDNASSADPVLVDIDGDNQVEVIKSVDNYAQDDAHDAIYAFQVDGTLLWKTLGFSGEDSPNVADLDGDGEVEIVGMTFGGEVYCLDSKGRVKWRKDLRPKLSDSDAHAYLAPILCDVDGDRELEILALTNGSYFDESSKQDNDHSQAPAIIFALSADGEILDRFDVGGPRYWGGAFVCNVDDDPFMELIVAGSGGMDVIETKGIGANTEHFQRRRNYQRLNVVPWAYEDSYFIYRGNKNGVINLTDNLVLAKVDGHYLKTGTFTTDVLTLPPGCLFDRITYESRTPKGTAIRLAILDAADNRLLDNVETNTELNLAQPVRLQFQISTTNSSQTPTLDAYRLTFRRNEIRNKTTKQ